MTESPITEKEFEKVLFSARLLEKKIFEKKADVKRAYELFVEGKRGDAVRTLRKADFLEPEVTMLIELWMRVPVPVKKEKEIVVRREVVYRPTISPNANSQFLNKTYGLENLKKVAKEMGINWRVITFEDFPVVVSKLEVMTGIVHWKR